MGLFGIGRKKRPLSAKQRMKKLRRLREEARLLQEEAKVTRQVRKERQEIKQLSEELHPSKVKRLAHLLGKTEHGGISVGKAFVKAHKEISKADKAFQKAKEKSGKGFIKYK